MVAETSHEEAPRAEAAVDVNTVKPIVLKGPTLLAQNDPYNSMKAMVKLDARDTGQVVEPAEKVDNREEESAAAETRDPKPEAAARATPVLRAIPVEPEPEETPVEIRRAVPVGPMDEVDQGALLKAVTPSPGQSGDE